MGSFAAKTPVGLPVIGNHLGVFHCEGWGFSRLSVPQMQRKCVFVHKAMLRKLLSLLE